MRREGTGAGQSWPNGEALGCWLHTAIQLEMAAATADGSAASIRYGVAKVVEDEAHAAGGTFAPSALRAAHEVVSQFLLVCADDCAAFSKHAKRQTITHDDVELVVRNSPSALAAVREAVESSKKGRTERAAKRKAAAGAAQASAAVRRRGAGTPSSAGASSVAPDTPRSFGGGAGEAGESSELDDADLLALV